MDILSACKADAESQEGEQCRLENETSEQGYGAFTLIKWFDGADDLDQDRSIGILELFAFVSQTYPK